MRKWGDSTYKKDAFYIYAIKNTVSQKIYVGCTTDIKKRMQQHFYVLRRGKHSEKDMQADFDKYGKDSFEVKVITSFENKLEASAFETFMMKLLKSQNPECGYNARDHKGNSPIAIADRWRTPVSNWSSGKRNYHFRKYGILLPPEYA